jgi:hypothetical protein
MHRKISTHLSASYKEFKNNATHRNRYAFNARDWNVLVHAYATTCGSTGGFRIVLGAQPCPA